MVRFGEFGVAETAMILRDVGLENVDSIHLAQDRDCCEYDDEPPESMKGGEFHD